MNSVYCGSPQSIDIMRTMDERVSPAFRALMHEYGFQIVAQSMDDGARNPDVLRADLEAWRDRRQQQWLATDYVGTATRESLFGAGTRR